MSLSHRSQALDLLISQKHVIVDPLDKKEHCAAIFVDLFRALGNVDHNFN